MLWPLFNSAQTQAAMFKSIARWWAARRAPSPMEEALMTPADNADQAMVGLARAFMLDYQRREAETRRAARFKRWMVALVVLGTVGLYAALAAKALLPTAAVVAAEPAVAVVKVEGQIAANAKLASADRVVAALTAAFEDPNVRRVLLYIVSPGGAPVEAERSMAAVAALRAKHNKPIQAVIGNLGASAGYMVALSADEIISGKYSLVGSVGAVLMAWDVHKVLERFDVKARSYASGSLKSMLNPREPTTPEAEAKAQALVDEMGRQFETLLKARRGNRLTQPPAVYTTGEVWGGQDALALGLVDGNGTLETVLAQTPDLKRVNFGPFERNRGLLPEWMQTLTELNASLRQATAWMQGTAPAPLPTP